MGDEQRRALLGEMGALLARRGPDDEQIHLDADLAFVFRRLSIVDVDGGAQPIWNESRDIFVAVNGELYNHRELRAGLGERHRFATRSDSEVLLHLYEEHGEAAFAMLNGMFAACLWDTRARRLVLARDRLGIKPLYVVPLAHGLLFGSELKALLVHPDCPREVDWTDVGNNGVIERREVTTYVKGIRHLAGGCYASIAPEQPYAMHRYWNLAEHLWTPDRGPADADPDACSAGYSGLIEESVRLRLMSDVPVGLFLSGGIDSSLIAAIAAEHNPEINAFTVVERSTCLAGDVATARVVAAEKRVRLHCVDYAVEALAEQFDLATLEAMIALIESPRFELDWFFKYKLHEYARGAVPDLKVMLIGQGADEFAGGYSARLRDGFADWRSYLEGEVRPTIRGAIADDLGLPERFRELLDDACYPPESEYAYTPFQQKMLAVVNQLQHFNLWHEDRSSAFMGVESRVPFLDHRLVEYCAGIPPARHARLFWDKRIVRDALQRRLPRYPDDKSKISFYMTDRCESIDWLYRQIAIRVFPEFLDKYAAAAAELFSLERVERLWRSVRDNPVGIRESDVWQVNDLMCAVLFREFCRDVRGFMRGAADHTAPLAALGDDAWDAREAAYGSADYSPWSWTLEDTVALPPAVRFLEPLTVDDDDPRPLVVVCREARVAGEFRVPAAGEWVARVLEKLGRREAPLSVAAWSRLAGVEAQAFVGFADALRRRGYLAVNRGPASEA